MLCSCYSRAQGQGEPKSQLQWPPLDRRPHRNPVQLVLDRGPQG